MNSTPPDPGPHTTVPVTGRTDDGRFLAPADRLTTPIWVFDIDLARIVEANPAAIALWRAESLEDLRARDLGADMSPAVRDRLRQYQGDFERSDSRFSEVWTLYPSGAPTTVRAVFSGQRLADGRMGMLCEAFAEMHDTPERLRSAEAVLHTPVMITLYDRDGGALYRNPAARGSTRHADERFADRFADPATHRAFTTRLDQNGQVTEVVQIATPAGPRWHEVSAHACHDAVSGRPACLVSEIDVTARKTAEDRIRHLAHHDQLTGLPNRTLLYLELERRLAAVAPGERTAVIFVDLDHFKEINDSFGHHHGDQLLVEVARRLKRSVRKSDFVARLGGDEFLVCVSLGQRAVSIEPVIQRILTALDLPVMLNGHEFAITASIGVCTHPEDGRDLDTLMRHADLAMYSAKNLGRGRWAAFVAGIEPDVEEEIETSLERAFERAEFELFYQPRLSIDGRRVVGAEALLRWHHPTRGVVLPDTFLRHIAKHGLMDRIGACVIREAARQQRAWVDLGHEITVSINLSDRQFHDPMLPATIAEIIAETGCDPRCLQIEITESALAEDEDLVAETLAILTDMGFSIAIDDFGTGRSNLPSIRRHPIDTLKIDESFVAAITDRPALAELVMGACRLLGLRIVAEGVETAEQLAWLRAHDCHEYQGHLFSPAIPADHFARLLEAQRDHLPCCDVVTAESVSPTKLISLRERIGERGARFGALGGGRLQGEQRRLSPLP